MLYDFDRDGTFDRADHDVDGDGVADRYGYDMAPGPHGEPNRWVEGSPVLEQPVDADHLDAAVTRFQGDPVVGGTEDRATVDFDGDPVADRPGYGFDSDTDDSPAYGVDRQPEFRDGITVDPDDVGAGQPAPDAALPEYEPDPLFAPVAEAADLTDALAAPDDGDAYVG